MWFFFSAIQGAFKLMRVCRKCKERQLVKLADQNESVQCKRCGSMLEPHHDQTPYSPW